MTLEIYRNGLTLPEQSVLSLFKDDPNQGKGITTEELHQLLLLWVKMLPEQRWAIAASRCTHCHDKEPGCQCWNR